MKQPAMVCAVLLVSILWTSGRAQVRAPHLLLTDSSLQGQWSGYQAEVSKSIVELQPFRRTESAESDRVTATLVNLNPQINTWFLLTLSWAQAGKSESFHLENRSPKNQSLTLGEIPGSIRIARGDNVSICQLWKDDQAPTLLQAKRGNLPYAPLCEERLFLRNLVAGTYTHLERVTNFLRDRVWGGERIVGFVRKQFYSDAFIENGDQSAMKGGVMLSEVPGGPEPPRIVPAFAGVSVRPDHLGIDLVKRTDALELGHWYPVRDSPGIFMSLIQPQAVMSAQVRNSKNSIGPIDAVEGTADDYMVAIDLDQHNLAFALGTDHPRVGWSERALPAVRNSELPGPDGIDGVAPLVVNGMVNPLSVEQVAVTFAGGFKREHGAFRFGPLALQNHGSHYGFIEQGVIFSKLQPELATLVVKDDDSVLLKTWANTDNVYLRSIKFARQNGVPLIDYDEGTRISAPGSLVNNWGPGNWSGSSDERLRTLRAGVCLQVKSNSRFLIFGYFSTATPSAMALVFQAYGCQYAMHLDMNALEHTYFALYTFRNGRIVVQHLIDGMEAVDRKGGNELAPRFLSFPDDRDFFYMTRKAALP